MWEKIMEVDSTKMTDYVILVCIFLAVVGGITTRQIFFVIGFLFVLYLFLNLWYEKVMGEKLILKNTKQTIRLFPGDKETLFFHFQNDSIFPFVNGKFRFQTGNAIITPEISEQHHDQFELPLALFSKGKTTLAVNVHAKNRGVAKISNIIFQYPHLFKFHSITLSYIPFFHKEIIVYPQPKKIDGLYKFFQIAPGLQQMRISPFEDIENRIGTRDYQYGDSFKHINWKASAKAQSLQTNTFERVVDKSLIIIVNLQAKENRNFPISSEMLERNLSYTAYLAQFAINQGYPYELFINMKNPGSIPYIHLPEGEGNAHYMHTLEMLARVHQYPMIIPITEMIYRIGQDFKQSKTIIIVGEILTEMNMIIGGWRSNHQILQIKEVNGAATIIPLRGKGLKQFAP